MFLLVVANNKDRHTAPDDLGRTLINLVGTDNIV